MKGSRSRRGRGKPFGAGGLRRKSRGKPRGTRRAPIDPPAAPDAPPAAASDELVAVAEAAHHRRPGRARHRPPPPPPPAHAAPSAIPCCRFCCSSSPAAAWPGFLVPARAPAPAGGETASGEKAGATTAVDLVELKRVLRRLDFAPGPDDGGLDPATREAIRQFPTHRRPARDRRTVGRSARRAAPGGGAAQGRLAADRRACLTGLVRLRSGKRPTLRRWHSSIS